MRKGILCLCTIMLLAGISHVPAMADEVILINGDRFTGKLLKRDGSRLQFKTEYAGKIKVRWEHVRSLKTEKPALLEFDNGDTKSVVSVDVMEEKVVYRDALDNQQYSLGVATGIKGISPEAWMNNKGGVLSGLVNFSYRGERGNGDENYVDFDADIKYLRRIDRWLLKGEWEHDNKVKSVTGAIKTTKDKWLVNGSYNYFLNKKKYIGGAVSLEQDEMSDLNLRTTLGPLLGYEFFKSRPLNLLVAVNFHFVDEKYSGGMGESSWQPGWHLKFDKYIYETFLQFYHEQYGTLKLNSPDNWFFKSWTGLRIPITQSVQASMEYKLEYENFTINDNDRTESTFRLKLGYKW